MSGRNKRTNPVLLFLVILMCLGCGFLFTQSSSTPSPIKSSSLPDMFVASKEDRSSGSKTKTDSSYPDETDDKGKKEKEELKTSEKKVQEEKYVFEVSPEASKGVWTSSGSHWIFLVDGEPYSGGWLNDTDGKRYYFGEDGIMQTGMIQADGQSYYLDLDGIMQTGDVTVEGKEYHFFPDGTMQTKEHPEMDPVPQQNTESSRKTETQEVKQTETASEAEQESETEEKEAKEQAEEKTEAEDKGKAQADERTEAEGKEEPVEAEEKEAKEQAEEKSKAEEKEKTKEAEEKGKTQAEEKSETEEKTAAETVKAPEAVTEGETAEDSEEKTEESKKKKKQKTKRIALTFDDGPGEYTDRLLDCLEKNGAKATFFVTGNHITAWPDTIIRMDQLGCEIGNHSYTHPDYADLNQTDGSAEIDGTNEVLTSLIGRGAGLFRPPYGLANDLVLSCTDLPIILWTSEISAEDGKTADGITEEVLSAAGDGVILLLYDTDSKTVEAAESFIPKLLSQGYELLTVSELAEANKITLQGKTVYDSLKK